MVFPQHPSSVILACGRLLLLLLVLGTTAAGDGVERDVHTYSRLQHVTILTGWQCVGNLVPES